MNRILVVLLLVFPLGALSNSPKPSDAEACKETVTGSIPILDQAQRIKLLSSFRKLLFKEPAESLRLKKALVRLTQSLESGNLQHTDEFFDLADKLIEMERWPLAAHLTHVLYTVTEPHTAERKAALFRVYDVLWKTKPILALQKAAQTFHTSPSGSSLMRALEFSARAIKDHGSTPEFSQMIQHLQGICDDVSRLRLAGQPLQILFSSGKKPWDSDISERMGRVVGLARSHPKLRGLVQAYLRFAESVLPPGYSQGEFLVNTLAQVEERSQITQKVREHISLIPDRSAQLQLLRLHTNRLREIKDLGADDDDED